MSRSAPHIAFLEDRAFIKISGEEAALFLNNLITIDITKMKKTAFGALLTPQGKIIADFILHKHQTSFVIDSHKSLKEDLLKRLSLYKLRAQINIKDESEHFAIVQSWQPEPGQNIEGKKESDPRHKSLGTRKLIEKSTSSKHAPSHQLKHWHQHRIRLGIAECGYDYMSQSLYPHDVALDQLGALSFEKGCYIGQEVVSRTKHRKAARTRPMLYEGTTPLPMPANGDVIKVENKKIGMMGASIEQHAIAFIRLDKITQMAQEKQKFHFETFSLTVPPWSCYDWPIK